MRKILKFKYIRPLLPLLAITIMAVLLTASKKPISTSYRLISDTAAAKIPEAASPAASAAASSIPADTSFTSAAAAPAPAESPNRDTHTAAPSVPPPAQTITQGQEDETTPDPVTLKISSIGLTAPIVKTGLEPNGALHVPSSPDMTGWYSLGPKPGDAGPAVLTGHLDSAAGPGILYNLKNVKPGDEIKIVRNDGTVAVFTVDKLEWYLQDDFNTFAVYGPISNAGLRIITCAGTYNKSTRHYSDDLVVYATLQRIDAPGAYQPL